jgi:hypothetical protein
MDEQYEALRWQIERIRDVCGVKLNSLEQARIEMRASLIRSESTLLSHSSTIEDLHLHMLDILERVSRIEQELNLPRRPARPAPAPTHEDKQRPEISPPQEPG